MGELKWTSADFAEAQQGRLPMGKPQDQWSYGDFEAVADLTLHVPGGGIFALLGPNGAGKTTTIRMLMGILQPSAGSARIDGLDCFADRVEVTVKLKAVRVSGPPVTFKHFLALSFEKCACE